MTLNSTAALQALRPYLSEHGVVPSLATLARLWGYASKASAAQIVTRLVQERALVRADAGRLRPGPQFHAAIERKDRHEMIVTLWRDRWKAEGLAEAYDLITRVTRLGNAVKECARNGAARSGLSVGELLVLDALERMGPPFCCAPTELRHHFALSLPGVGKRIASLEKQGLIDRVRSAKDGRCRLVQLNAKGRARLEQAAQADMEAPHIRWAAELGPAARAGLIDTLRHALNEIEHRRST